MNWKAHTTVRMSTDNETPVTDEYKERSNKFTGRINRVTGESARWADGGAGDGGRETGRS